MAKTSQQLLLLCLSLNLCGVAVAEDPCAVAPPATTVNPVVIGGSVAAGVAAAVGIGVGIWDGVQNKDGKNGTNPREVVTSTTGNPVVTTAAPAPPVSPTTISPRVLDPTSTTVAAALSSSASLPVWAWICLALLLCLGAVCCIVLATIVCKPRKNKAAERQFRRVSASPSPSSPEVAEAETSFTPFAPLSSQMSPGYVPLPTIVRPLPTAHMGSPAYRASTAPGAMSAVWVSPMAATAPTAPPYATATRLAPAHEAIAPQVFAAPLAAAAVASPVERNSPAPAQAPSGYANLGELAYGAVGSTPQIVAEYVPAGSAV